MRRSCTARWAASSTATTPRPARSASTASAFDDRSRSNTSSSPRPNSSGSTRLTTTAARSTPVSSSRRPASSMVSVTGISSGVVTMSTPGAGGVLEDVEHPLRLVVDHPDVHEVVDGLGAGQLAGDVAGRRGVDDHEVVVALPHLVGHLADGEDLLHARRGVGHEVERAGQRTEAAQQRDAQLQAEVLLQRVLGVHGHGEQVGLHLAGLEGERGALVGRGQRALGVHLADQGPLALAGREQPERRGDGGLAHAALAGDEQELPVQERGGHRGPGVSSRSRSGGRRQACRSRRRRCAPTGRPPPGPARRRARARRSSELRAASTCRLQGVTIGVAAHLEQDLPRGLDHTDANVHVEVLLLWLDVTLRRAVRQQVGRDGSGDQPELLGHGAATDGLAQMILRAGL